MVDEYIRREDVLKGKKTGTFANGICFVAEPCVTVKYIESLEPADVVQVVHGEWIPQDHNKRIGCATTAVFYYPKCSACGNNGNYDMNFCPNCGAKMDKG